MQPMLPDYMFIARSFRQVSFAGHRSQVTGHRSRVTGHRSHQNQKAISDTGNVIITRDSQEVYRYCHVTNVSLNNFNENFLGVVYVLIGLKYRHSDMSWYTYFIVIRKFIMIAN